MKFNNKTINSLGKTLALIGALMGILIIIPNGGFTQLALVGVGCVMVFATEKY